MLSSPVPAPTPQQFLVQPLHTEKKSSSPFNWLGEQLSEETSTTRKDGYDSTPVHSHDCSRLPVYLHAPLDTQLDNLKLIAMLYNDNSQEVSFPITDEFSSPSTLSPAVESEWSPLSSHTSSRFVFVSNHNNLQNSSSYVRDSLSPVTDSSSAKINQPEAMAESTSPTTKISLERNSFSLANIAKSVNIETLISDSGFRTPYKNLYRDVTEGQNDPNSRN